MGTVHKQLGRLLAVMLIGLLWGCSGHNYGPSFQVQRTSMWGVGEREIQLSNREWVLADEAVLCVRPSTQLVADAGGEVSQVDLGAMLTTALRHYFAAAEEIPATGEIPARCHFLLETRLLKATDKPNSVGHWWADARTAVISRDDLRLKVNLLSPAGGGTFDQTLLMLQSAAMPWQEEPLPEQVQRLFNRYAGLLSSNGQAI